MHDPDKVIYNFSSHKLTETEKSLLSKGLKFALSPNKLEYSDYMLPFELLFRDIKTNDISNQKSNSIKSKIQDTAFSSFDSFKTFKPKSNLTDPEIKALNKLMKQKDLVIQKADKGNVVVIIDKKAYLNKIKSLLSDATKFEKLDINEGKDLNFIINAENNT